MTVINIPFNSWSKERLLIGGKKATSRNKKYGQVGDVFVVGFERGVASCTMPFSHSYKLTHVEHVTLGFVADHCWRLEGAVDREEFIEVWNDIHPKKRFDKNQKVYLHVFD
jgi:hypothetical protein